MPERRRRFSPQFKAEAVQMVRETGRSTAEVARDLGIHNGTLGNWVNAWRRQNPEPDQPLTPVERAHVKELEDEIRRLRMENEFLKKAAAYVAGEPGHLPTRVLRANQAPRLRQVPGLHRRCAQRFPFRKLIARPGDAGRAWRPHGIGLGGRLRAQA